MRKTLSALSTHCVGAGEPSATLCAGIPRNPSASFATSYDFRHRFFIFGVPVEVLNSRIAYDSDGYDVLKTLIAGAFYRRYVRAEYRNLDERRRYLGASVF